MRVALFGGSFDPPHRGHIAIAKAAADRFHLDQILFAPAGRQPLKTHAPGASFECRLRMTELACAEDRRFGISLLDAPRKDGTPNYTVDTLDLLQVANAGYEIFNLAGADSFHSLASWHDPQRLLSLAQWIVVSRPGHDLTDPPGLILTEAQRSRIHLLDSMHEDVAATDLRERLRTGDPCADLLTPAVSAYIQQHRLYLAG
jgi:nicotinate-nucleotide adenylyltransferase